MIELILELLKSDEFKGKSKVIDIAKGKYQVPNNFKEIINMVNRYEWQDKKK